MLEIVEECQEMGFDGAVIGFMGATEKHFIET
jgi:hypothetical protein